MLPWTSPTKATSGVTFLSAGPRSPQGVSDRRPAPTKATPPGDQLPANLCPHKTTITRAHKNWGSSNLFPPPVLVFPPSPSHLGEGRGEGQIGISNHKGWFKSLSEIRWQNLPPF